MYLRVPTDLSAYPPRYASANMLNARCAIFACMNIEAINRVRISIDDIDVDDGDDTDNRLSGMKP